MAKKVAQAFSIKSGHLGHLMQHVKQLKVLNDAVMQALESPLKEHCHVANFDGTNLTIQADSAVWATQLQFISEQLRFSVQQQMPFADLIQSIKIQVRPNGSELNKSESKAPPPAEISNSSKDYISDFAESLEESDLKEAFRRLGKRT